MGWNTLKKVMKISSAVLALGLISSSTIQVMATEKVDSSSFETVNLQDALHNIKEETTTVKNLQTIATSIPSGYLSNNLFALAQNIEKISNPKAKAALQKNINKAIKKWEEKDKTEIPTTDKGIVEDEVSVETNVETAKTEEPAPKIVKVPKEEKQVAKEAKKTEKKAIKDNKKQQRKEEQVKKKENQKQIQATKKEQHKADKSKKQK